MSVCANCYTSEGPFAPLFTFNDVKRVCKNTKTAQDRVSKCVERRVKIDTERYKEVIDITLETDV